MITEFALITISPGMAPQFEAAFSAAMKVMGGSQGYVSHELQRSIKTPNRYALLVQWQTLEDHTVRFRASPAFTECRSLIGPFFQSPPVVEYFEPLSP